MKIYIKRTLIAFLIVISGCSTATKKKKYVVGFSQFTTKDDWRKAMIQSMKVEAQFYNEIELQVLDGKGNVDNQIENVSHFIDNKVDVLIVSPIAPKPLRAIINKAIKANIPVIILDREIEGVEYQSFIGVDNYEIGLNSAKYIASLKSEAAIIEVKGWAGTTPIIQRSLGFNSIVNKTTGLEIVGTTQDQYGGPGIKKHFKKLLEQNEKVNFVFAHTDALALKAYEVAKELGREKTITFIGVGGVNSLNGGIYLVEKDILKASILLPTGGKEAIDAAMNIINHQKVKKTHLLPSLVIDADNVGVVKRQAQLILSQELDIEKQQAKIKNQYKLYTSQSAFLKFTIFSLMVIVGLLVLTFFAKRKLTRQKKMLEDSVVRIASQTEELVKSAKELHILNESTNNFFTGVSHDFKTPISLILSSVESLLTENDTTKPKEYSLIYNNSKRLLKMINQLLDFKKLEHKKVRLQAVKTNVNEFVGGVYLDFESEAIKRAIDFSFEKSAEKTEVYIDRSMFDNVLFNLLSNAFKFTPSKGKITIKINDVSEGVFVSVKDSGIGILAAEKDKIFKQFFQGSNNKQTSSGIGLYIVKQYIELHHGTIEVVSSKGNGTEFKIYIPKGKSHFSFNEVLIEDTNTANNYEEAIDIKHYSFEENEVEIVFDEEKETILIIEDNTDLRQFLKGKLKSYNVYESDGIGAVKTALTIIPDIIISDVNLPEKNGFEITEALKKDERTSHIPVLILTALSSNEAHVQGLKSGVDMFLTKPFNLSLLNQSLKTLLYNRKRLQLSYKQNFDSESLKRDVESRKKVKSKDLEQAFFNRINDIVSKNMDDSTFTVEILAEELQMSRVQLYRKTKAVLGINISDYIQNIRLEESKKLLKDSKLTIADVAYSTGFSSPNYFSTSFKNKYGKTPNQFKKEKF